LDFVKPMIRHVLYPYMAAAKGNRVRENLKRLQATDFDNYEKLREQQANQLRKLLVHCIDNVPQYAPYASLRADILQDPFRALGSFPVLTKDAFRGNPHDFLATGVQVGDLIANRTGGSTGEPLQFYLDRTTVEMYEACRFRGLGWHGIRPWDRSVMVWGQPLGLSRLEHKKNRTLERILKNRIAISAYALNMEEIDAYTGTINAYRPDYIYGYSSALYTMARMMEATQSRITHRVKGVVSTAENLFPHQRDVIERVFHSRCVNEYGARDGGIIAYECQYYSMHVSMESLYVETVELHNNQTTTGSGRLLITDLNNFVMPRLRYEVGDVVRVECSKCACGRAHVVLSAIEGRIDDTFITMNGTHVHGHLVNHLARDLNAFAQFQVIQHAPDRFEVLIVKNEQTTQEQVERFVNGILQRFEGAGATVAYVDEIPKSESGKVRYAIRRF